MRMEVLDGAGSRRYSTSTLRFLITMVGRRALHRMHASANLFLMRPFVVMAARALGPGPTRLKLVKLAPNLSAPELVAEPARDLAYVDGHASSQPTQRAA